MNWRFEHLRHVTSANSATICRVTERRDMTALAKSLVTQYNSAQAVAVKYFMAPHHVFYVYKICSNCNGLSEFISLIL